MNKPQDFPESWHPKPDLLPGISVDCVIFGFHDGQLKILLLEYKNTGLFALPGGFVQKNEDLDTAARRMLEDRTALSKIYLEQFYTFSTTSRRNDETHRTIATASGRTLEADHFIFNRFISVGYYALVDFSTVVPTPDAISDSCNWHDISSIPQLIFDHNLIVNKALDTLRFMLDSKLNGFNLLPPTFTMNELQQLYETILGKKLVRSNFQRKMLSLGILQRLDKKQTGAANKAPYLYCFIKPQTTL